jgi:hypothetical protein
MSSTYFHQTYLPVPSLALRTTRRFVNQPFSHSDLDTWLNANRRDAYRRNVLLSGYLGISDVPQDQVLCTVVMVVEKVRITSTS